MLANVKLTGLVARYPSGSLLLLDNQVTCTLRAGDQDDTSSQALTGEGLWTQHLAVTLTAPGRLTVACSTPKFERRSARDYAYMLVRHARLTAVRMPQTQVSRAVTLSAIVAATPRTRERKPLDPTAISAAALKRDELLARALKQR